MLRITRTDGDDGVVLKLEGRLVGPWVDLLKKACELCHRETGEVVTLECTVVHFADKEGQDLLRNLHDRGVVRTTCSPFLQHLISDVHKPRASVADDA